eukprot:2017200-Rhodomonas_salina.1
MMHCLEVREAQNLMHNQIAGPLIKGIAAALRGRQKGHDAPTVTTHIGPCINSLWPDCPPDIKSFVPDGIIIRVVDTPQGCKSKPTIGIVEFACCYTIEIAYLEDNAATKQNQYQGNLRFLTAHYPQHK